MSLPADHSDRRRAHSAISLGAAIAVFGAVLLGYDAPASQAAGGFFEMLFGPSRPEASAYSPRRYRFSHGPRRLRFAHHVRRHGLQARRQIVERRKAVVRHFAAASTEQRHTLGPAVIDIIAPTRSPFVQVIGSAGLGEQAAPTSRAPAKPTQSLPAGCPKPCAGGPIATLAPQTPPPGRTDIYADPTLRPGDTVITAEGVRILRPGSRFPFRASDFVTLAEAGKTPLSTRNALQEIERALKTPMGRPPADL